MDVVLEIADTYIFDRVWATLLPLSSPAVNTIFDPISTLTASWTGYEVNQTFGTSEGGAGVGHGRSEWEYAPASKYFGVRPSEYAWMSAWSRDNAWRQFVTLYLVTMYV
jgi:Delta7-sterol 5-desaturase